MHRKVVEYYSLLLLFGMIKSNHLTWYKRVPA